MHFINDQHDPVLVADSSKLGQKVRIRNYIATFALHRLDYDGRAVFRRDRGLENGLFDIAGDAAADPFTFAAFKRKANRVRIRHMINIESLRPEASPLCGS